MHLWRREPATLLLEQTQGVPEQGTRRHTSLQPNPTWLNLPHAWVAEGWGLGTNYKLGKIRTKHRVQMPRYRRACWIWGTSRKVQTLVEMAWMAGSWKGAVLKGWEEDGKGSTVCIDDVRLQSRFIGADAAKLNVHRSLPSRAATRRCLKPRSFASGVCAAVNRAD